MNAQSHSHSRSSKVSVLCLNPSRHVTKSVPSPAPCRSITACRGPRSPWVLRSFLKLGSRGVMSFPWEASLGKQGVVHSLHSARQQDATGSPVFSCRRILPAMPALGLRKSSFKFRKWRQSQGGTNFPSGAFSDFGSLCLNETLELLLLLLLSLRHLESWAVGIFAQIAILAATMQPPRRLLRGSSSNTQHHQGGTISFH